MRGQEERVNRGRWWVADEEGGAVAKGMCDQYSV